MNGSDGQVHERGVVLILVSNEGLETSTAGTVTGTGPKYIPMDREYYLGSLVLLAMSKNARR